MLHVQIKLLSFTLCIFFLVACEKNSDPKSEKNITPEPVVEKVTEQVDTLIESSCKLTMGWEPWEPYHYQDQDNKVKGLDIELMEMIARETNCEITYLRGNWKALLEGIRNGDVDFLTGASITEKRKKYAKFSVGYRTESFRLFIRSGELEKYPGYNMRALIDDGFRLGITMDYIYNDEVNSLQDDPVYAEKIVAVSTGLINFAKLLDSEIDGFLEDPVVGRSSIRRNGLENEIELHPYTINTGDVHIIFSRASVEDEIIDKFNRALTSITADGRHQRLMNKYTN